MDQVEKGVGVLAFFNRGDAIKKIQGSGRERRRVRERVSGEGASMDLLLLTALMDRNKKVFSFRFAAKSQFKRDSVTLRFLALRHTHHITNKQKQKKKLQAATSSLHPGSVGNT